MGDSNRMRAMALRGSITLPGKAGKCSHYSDEWYTPESIPAAIGGFDLDPCAGPSSHARVNVRRPDCGLASPWHGRVWLNPPYSNVHDWLERLANHGDGVALVNARPETQWFQNAASRAVSALWLRRRVEFLRPDAKPTHTPVGSVLLAYGLGADEALRKSGLAGIYTRILLPL